MAPADRVSDFGYLSSVTNSVAHPDPRPRIVELLALPDYPGLVRHPPEHELRILRQAAVDDLAVLVAGLHVPGGLVGNEGAYLDDEGHAHHAPDVLSVA